MIERTYQSLLELLTPLESEARARLQLSPYALLPRHAIY